MTDPEITFSEELSPKSWRQWAKENGMFLSIIGLLSSISLYLLIQNQMGTFTEDKSQPILTLPSLPSHSTPFKMKSIPKDPFFKASQLLKEEKFEEAIQDFLKLSKIHPNFDIRKKASQLAKKAYVTQKKKMKIKEMYLEGYVLFTTYPQKACERWQKIISSSLTDDPYYQKAKKKWDLSCHVY